jgi:L-alanine-DL-glutamate epimerase-like enolase superfamily enzyme
MELRTQPLDLRLASAFRISRGVQHVARTLAVSLSVGEESGIGEAAPSAFYGETRETVLAALPRLVESLGEDPTRIEDAHAAFNGALSHGHAAAKAALDMALYDLMGKRLGVPIYQLLGLNPERTPCTSFTIAIAEPVEMARRAAEAREFPILKIKLGTEADLDIVRAIRDVTDATIRVDANAAWTPKQAIRIIARLEAYGVEFVEQPVAAHDLDGLRLVRENSALPIIADESCVTLEDIPRVVGCADGINIKLMKCGGIRNALAMIHAARAHHLKVMLGCMIESSLAITAAAQISPLVDYADLDGGLLITNDPYDGVRVERGKLMLPERAGLGALPRENMSAELEN